MTKKKTGLHSLSNIFHYLIYEKYVAKNKLCSQKDIGRFSVNGLTAVS